jgi:hypothetical protein
VVLEVLNRLSEKLLLVLIPVLGDGNSGHHGIAFPEKTQKPE